MLLAGLSLKHTIHLLLLLLALAIEVVLSCCRVLMLLLCLCLYLLLQDLLHLLLLGGRLHTSHTLACHSLTHTTCKLGEAERTRSCCLHHVCSTWLSRHGEHRLRCHHCRRCEVGRLEKWHSSSGCGSEWIRIPGGPRRNTVHHLLTMPFQVTHALMLLLGCCSHRLELELLLDLLVVKPLLDVSLV